MVREASQQVMSLLPRTPSSRGLCPRTAALRSSFAGLSSARLPRLDGTVLSSSNLNSTPVSTRSGEGHSSSSALRQRVLWFSSRKSLILGFLDLDTPLPPSLPQEGSERG